MSLATNVANLATRLGTEFKAVYAKLGDLTSLTTSTKTSLVAAVNELDAAIDAAAASGGATNLDQLTDVVLTAPADGHLLRYNGTSFVNTLGTTYFDAAGSSAAAAAASQPLDSDLTAIAALTTTSYGRAFLTLANQAALNTLVGAASLTAAGVVELATVAETTTGTDAVRAVTPAGVAAVKAAVKSEILGAGVPAALDTLDELAAALADDANYAATVTTALANKQPLDTDLTAIAGLTSAADKLPYATGAGLWSLTTFTAAGRALVDDVDVAAQRATLSVYSQADIGDPTTDFVATFNAALV